MTVIRQYTGSAPKVAQRDQLTPQQLLEGAVVRLYFAEAPSHYLEYTCLSDSAADWVTAIVTLWNDSLDPLFAEATAEASDDGLTVVVTADTPGNPLCSLAVLATGTVAPKLSEIDTLTLPSSPTVPTGGTWLILFGGYTTDALAWNANSATIQAALVALPSIGSGNVTVGGTGPFSVYFGGDLANQNLAAPTAVSYLLGLGTITPSVVRDGVAGTDEIQGYTIGPGVTSGTYTIAFRGATSANLAFDANSAQVQTALEGVSTIGTGNILVGTTATEGQFLLTYQGALGSADLPEITINSAGEGAVEVTAGTTTQGYAQNDTQVVTFSGANSGTYTLVFNGQTTGELFYNSSAYTIRTTLEQLSTIGAGNVWVLPDPVTISFIGALASLPQSLLGYNNYLTYLIAVTPIIATTQEAIVHVDGVVEVQRVSFGSAPGEWDLIWNSVSAGGMTSESTASDVNTALGTIGCPASAGDVEAGVVDVSFTSAGVQPLLTSSEGAVSITEQVEGTDPVGGQDEQQTITWTTAPNAGTWVLIFDGQETAAMNHNVDAAGIQAALEALSNIQSGNVSVSGAPGAWTVDFCGTLGETGVAELGLQYNTLQYLTGDTSIDITRTYVGGHDNEVQTLTADGTPDAGTFSLTFNDYTTGNLAWNANAADVRTEFGSLTSVGGTANILVSGDDITAGLAVTFQGDLANADQNAMAVNSALTGILSIAVATSQDGINGRNCQQTVTYPTTVTGGTFQLVFSDGTTTLTTASIAWNANAATVQATMEALSTIDSGDVEVTGTAGALTVEFKGDLSGASLAAMTAVNYLTGGNLCAVSTVTTGVAGTDESQTLWVNYATEGNWNVGLSGTTNVWSTTLLSYDATAAEVQAAIAAAPISKSVTVTKDTTSSDVTGYRVRFIGANRVQAQPQLIGRPVHTDPTINLFNRWGGTITRNAQGRAATDDVQRLVVNAASGTWVPNFNGAASTAAVLNWNATAGEVQTALEGCSTIGAGNVTVTDYATGGGYLITFGGTLAGADQPDVVGNTSGLALQLIQVQTDITHVAVTGRNTAHVLGLTSEINSFTVQVGMFFNAAETEWMSFTASYGTTAANIQNQVNSVYTANLPAGAEIYVSGGPAGVAALVFQFAGTLGNRRILLTTSFGAAWHVVRTQGDVTDSIYILDEGATQENQQQTLTYAGAPTSGTWTLTHNVGAAYYTTSGIQWNTSAAQIQTALQVLTSIGGGNVTVTGSYTTGIFVVEFLGALAGTSPAELSATSYMPSTTAATITVSEITKGAAAQDESQTLTLLGKGTSGAFKLLCYTTPTSAPYQTAAIASPYTAAAITAALETFYGATNVVTTDADGGPFTIVWQNALAGTAVQKLGYYSYLRTGPGPTVTWTRDVTGYAGVNPAEQVLFTTDVTAGTWTLTVKGATTRAIPYNATTAEVQDALRGLSTVTETGATVTETTGGYVLTFAGPLAATVLESGDVTADGAHLVIAAYAPTVTVTVTGLSAGNEQQLLTPMSGLTGGTWTFTFDGHTTTALAYNASNATIQAALDVALGFGNTAVTLGPLPNTAPAVEFKGSYANTNCALAVIGGVLTVLLPAPTIVTTQQGDPGTTVDCETTTASRSPSDWIDVANWSDETFPVAGEGIVLKDCDVPIKWNLPDGTSGVRYAFVKHYSSFSAAIGLPRNNTEGSEPYREPRQQSLALEADSWEFGIGDGPGSKFINATIVDSTDSVVIYNTGTSDDGARPALILDGNTGTSPILILKGSVGLQYYPEQTLAVPTVQIGNSGQVEADVSLWIGENVTVVTILQYGGSLVSSASFTTHTLYGGRAKYLAGTPGTIHVYGTSSWRALVIYCTPENATLLDVDAYGTVNFGQDLRAVTITTITIAEGGRVLDPTDRLSYSTCDHPEYINGSDSTTLLPGES